MLVARWGFHALNSGMTEKRDDSSGQIELVPNLVSTLAETDNYHRVESYTSAFCITTYLLRPPYPYEYHPCFFPVERPSGVYLVVSPLCPETSR